MDKSTISMVMFNSYVSHYQRQRLYLGIPGDSHIHLHQLKTMPCPSARGGDTHAHQQASTCINISIYTVYIYITLIILNLLISKYIYIYILYSVYIYICCIVYKYINIVSNILYWTAFNPHSLCTMDSFHIWIYTICSCYCHVDKFMAFRG